MKSKLLDQVLKTGSALPESRINEAAELPAVPPKADEPSTPRAWPAIEFSITPNLAASESTGAIVDTLREGLSRLGVAAKITIHF